MFDARHQDVFRVVALALALACHANANCLATERDTFTKAVRPFFENHCIHCHDESLAEGNLNLDALRPDFLTRPAADHWVEVLDRINLGEMPPQDEPRPDVDELLAVTSWITGQVMESRRQRESVGDRVPLRRMTRREYANTVRDLLSVDFVDGQGPIDWLPPDGSIQGFDRNSKALLIDPSLMETYIDVAKRLVDRAIQMRPPRIPQRTVRYEYRDVVGSAMEYQIKERGMYLEGDTLVVVSGSARSFAKLRHPANNKEVPMTGRYRVRIKASACPGADGKPVYMRVSQGGQNSIAQFRVDATPDSPEVYEFETVRSGLLQGEYNVALVDSLDLGRYIRHRGKQRRAADEKLAAGDVRRATVMKARLRAQGGHAQGAYRTEFLDLSKLPQLRLDWIEVSGPLQGEYPPESMKRLLPRGWESDTFDDVYVREIFERFLPRVYRRPVSPQELGEILSIVRQDLDAGNSYPTAIKTGLIATLCSPKFLYLFEPNAVASTDTGDSDRRRLSDHELATRLSYFLWSSMPDRQLSELASSGKLSGDLVLRTQVDRMIADPRFQGFLDGFVRQWLKIDEFDRFEPDKAIFPEYHRTEFVGIEKDILAQPIEFLKELIHRDESLGAILDSDWTVVNGKLASYYGMNGVSGETFQRVKLTPEQRMRGGLLGMAGLHRWGSDGSRTKPVERGKYILDVLFNDPPPPPPPNAGEVEPNVRGETLTVGQRLAKHREQTTCMNCHRRIDPYGLAMENFNVIGHWRERIDGEKPLHRWGDDRPMIEIGGMLPGGQRYNSFDEFKQTLITQRERFLRGLTEKLLGYALGRTVQPTDRPLIDSIVRHCQDQGETLRSILHGIVASKTFQVK